MLQGGHVDLAERYDGLKDKEIVHQVTEKDLGRCMQAKSALDENLVSLNQRSNERQQRFQEAQKSCTDVEQKLLHKTKELAISEERSALLQQQLTQLTSKFTSSEALLAKLREQVQAQSKELNDMRIQNERLSIVVHNRDQQLS
jgi:chromosome segregation ATPase